MLQPAFSSARRLAGTGPMPMIDGSTPADAQLAIRYSEVAADSVRRTMRQPWAFGWGLIADSVRAAEEPLLAFVLVNATRLAPGQSVSLTLLFSNPKHKRIRFTAGVLAGEGVV